MGSEACERRAEGLVDALVAQALAAGEDPLDRLLAHQVPATVAVTALDRRAPERRRSQEFEQRLEAERAAAGRLERARSLTESALAGLDAPIALPPSLLGVLWQHDVDLIAGAADLERAVAALRDAGFLDLEPLLRRIGRAVPGVHRLGAHDQGEPLGAVEVCTRLDDFGPPAEPALARAISTGEGLATLSDPDAVRRRCAKIAAARRPTVRAVIELLALVAAGAETPPERDVAVAFRRCARLEHELTGESLLADAAAGFERRLNWTWPRARATRVSRAARRRVSPTRFTVAFSGIDGAGKSTQAARFVAALGTFQVPAKAIWLRIGYGDSRLLKSVSRFGRRLLPAGSGDAMVARAGGAPPDAHATRRGPLGWAWALAVTLNFVSLARRTVRRTRGAVLANDRALPDALVGLEEGWGGSVSLAVQAWILERFAPRADLTVYLRIDPAVALGRKEDIFAGRVLEEHARAYDRLLPSRPGVVTIDAERPIAEIGLEVLATACERSAKR